MSSVCFVPPLWAVFPCSVSHPLFPSGSCRGAKALMGVWDRNPCTAEFPHTQHQASTESDVSTWMSSLRSESHISVTRPRVFFSLKNIMSSAVHISWAFNVANICLASQTGGLVSIIKLYPGIWMPMLCMCKVRQKVH